MITEDYVSFETAKLLKEKGFEGQCSVGQVCTEISHNEDSEWTTESEVTVGIPTLQMAIKWLREKHNQNITVKAHNNVARLKTIYYAEVQNLSEPTEKGFCVNGCTFKDTYEEACESAIKYCLENLI